MFRDRAPYYVISSMLARNQVGSQNVIMKTIVHRRMSIIYRFVKR